MTNDDDPKLLLAKNQLCGNCQDLTENLNGVAYCKLFSKELSVISIDPTDWVPYGMRCDACKDTFSIPPGDNPARKQFTLMPNASLVSDIPVRRGYDDDIVPMRVFLDGLPKNYPLVLSLSKNFYFGSSIGGLPSGTAQSGDIIMVPSDSVTWTSEPWRAYRQNALEIKVVPVTGMKALQVLQDSRGDQLYRLVAAGNTRLGYDGSDAFVIVNESGIIFPAEEIGVWSKALALLRNNIIELIPVPNSSFIVNTHRFKPEDPEPERRATIAELKIRERNERKEKEAMRAALRGETPAKRVAPKPQRVMVNVTTVPVIIVDMDDDDENVEVRVNSEELKDA